MRRYELLDSQWLVIESLFPKKSTGRGRPCRSHREILNGILWVLCSGAAWRDLPERYGPWKTVYDRFRRWQQSGLFELILRHLQLKLNEQGLIDWQLWEIDSTMVKAAKAAAGAKKKREI
jgi:transposase